VKYDLKTKECRAYKNFHMNRSFAKITLVNSTLSMFLVMDSNMTMSFWNMKLERFE
jgi:hypothetical protein